MAPQVLATGTLSVASCFIKTSEDRKDFSKTHPTVLSIIIMYILSSLPISIGQKRVTGHACSQREELCKNVTGVGSWQPPPDCLCPVRMACFSWPRAGGADFTL